MENSRSDKKDELRFSTQKIIIEDLSKRGGNLVYHFLIKIENPTEKEISLPIIGLHNHNDKEIKTIFYLELFGKKYSTVSYLNGKGNESLVLNPKVASYILLSVKDKINRNDLESGFINYAEKTKFRIVETDTERIFMDRKINIEEAVKLVHGKINGKQY